jgi:pimeloyl-ACP methyl ester carboxylesterase
VFLFDYRGYGRSEGRPSEEGTYEDGMAACQWLYRKGFAETNIVLFGESLGGGIASELATRIGCAGLVLQSTFTSIIDIGAELFPWLPVRWISTIKYDTLSKLPHIKAPVLIMHSRDDRLIGFSHSQRNFDAANEPKLFCELAGEHNDPLTNRSQFIADVEKFLQLVAKTAKQSAAGRK